MLSFYTKNHESISGLTSHANKNVGILGGTFDPVHLGHLIIAESVLDALVLDEIWFMPSHIPPHKQSRPITEGKHRIEMLKRAIAGNPKFQITTIEFERNKFSYTYDTMVLLKERYPKTQFYFIIGADMVESLPEWYRFKELVEMVQFVALERPGYKREIGGDLQVEERSDLMEKIMFIHVPQIDLSSSVIRKIVQERRSARYLIPEEVRKYIEEQGLYVG